MLRCCCCYFLRTRFLYRFWEEAGSNNFLVARILCRLKAVQHAEVQRYVLSASVCLYTAVDGIRNVVFLSSLRVFVLEMLGAIYRMLWLVVKCTQLICCNNSGGNCILMYNVLRFNEVRW